MPSIRGRFRHGPIALAQLALLAGCAAGPDFHRPAPPPTTRYTTPQPEKIGATPALVEGLAASDAQRIVTGVDVPPDWWTLLGCAPLDELVTEALRNSPDVQSAAAALRSAEANYAATRGQLLLPGLDAKAGVTHEKDPGVLFGQPGAPSSTFTLFQASVAVAYRLDIAGASRRQVEALRAQSDYRRFELEASRLALAANLATTAVNAASLRAQRAAVADILTSERAQLGVVERQLAVGAVARGDLLLQRSQLAQTEASLPSLEKALAQAQHRAAVLAGRTPDTETLGDLELTAFKLPSELPLTVPAELVRRRPDVRAAEALLHAATAQLGVATANLFPQLNLSGQVGSDSVAVRDWFGPGTGAWGLAAGLTQPIFHGGELWQRRKAARADLEQAAAQYRGVVLAALQDVADVLRALEADARTLTGEAAAESAARESLDLVRRQYRVGAIGYTTLLISERQYLQARQARVQAEGARYADTIALYQALGGGWWNRNEESAP